MNQPRLIRHVLLLALVAAAPAQADGTAQAVSTSHADDCTGTLRAAPGVTLGSDALITRVIFHDGSHPPVSVPVSTRDDDSDSSVAAAESAGGGSSSSASLPGTDSSKTRSGPRWQSFLPGSLK
jgi:hypothetical protein